MIERIHAQTSWYGNGKAQTWGKKKRLNFSMELKGGPFGACKGLLAQTPGGEGDLSQWRPLGARPWLIVLQYWST